LWIDLLKIFNDNTVDILIGGGINSEQKKLALDYGISIIDNVSCSAEDIIKAIENKILRPGFGFSTKFNSSAVSPNEEDSDIDSGFLIDCLACSEQQCLEGKTCTMASELSSSAESKKTRQILESAMDISLEEERTLCRISEIVYFALELNYKKIGIAYCVDLSDPAEIFTQVMRRFFDVYPVCCKIGGQPVVDPMEMRTRKIACNPDGQAEILNKIGVDLNIIIGLCIGADCIFSEFSNAPVTTLFVKDKSLANNPIGAVYSDYYLKEVTSSLIS
jgi:uncharacterized metal-binding protein